MLLRLCISVEPARFADRLGKVLSRQDLLVRRAAVTEEWLPELRKHGFDLVLVSRSSLPEDAGSMVAALRSLPERPDLIVFEREPDEADRAALLAQGCLAVLSGSLDDPALAASLGALIDRRRSDAIRRVQTERPEERYSLDDFISESAAMQRFVATARKVVRTDSSVLFLGETGVGKGRLAQAIHAEGARSNGPFVAVHCAALPESLLESELFGHEAGAFTGASRARKGYFELAHGGTIFLDEIGEVPPHIQVKLLKVLEERRIHRVGGEKPFSVNVRVMAATNRDLETEMKEKRFRPDLFYRLAVVTLTIPPLRERREDIEKLALGYLEHFRQQVGRADIAIDPEALGLLLQYDWPGNVRELINAMERSVLLCSEDVITVEDLPRRITNATVPDDDHPAADVARGAVQLTDDLLDRSLPEARAELVAAFERAYATRLLEKTKGKIGEAARRAGVNPRHLYDLLRRRGLRKEDFKRRDS